MKQAKEAGQESFYMMELGPSTIIDARNKGNLARLLNSRHCWLSHLKLDFQPALSRCSMILLDHHGPLIVSYHAAVQTHAATC